MRYERASFAAVFIYRELHCMNKNPVIVLGMHRSGTSAVAGVLHKLGVEMGTDLMLGDSEANPAGYYEDRPVMKLNEDILTCWGGSWDRVPTAAYLSLARLPDKLAFGVRDYLDNRTLCVDRWGWKDPRTVLTLSVWLPLLNNPKIVIVQRNSASVLRSLDLREKKKTINECRALMQLYENRLQRQTSLTDNFTLPYEQLIVEPENIIDDLVSFINHSPSAQQLQAAVQHVDPDLNRNG